MCEECLLTNRQGKSFCKREDDCLAYQDDLSSPGEPASPIVDYLINEFSLDAQVKRVTEILEELEELKGLLDDLEGEGSAQPLEVDSRIPGFCAHKLAEESAALLDLISLRVEFIRKEQELSDSPSCWRGRTRCRAFSNWKAGPKILQYRDFAKQFSDIDVSQLVESIGSQDQEQGS